MNKKIRIIIITIISLILTCIITLFILKNINKEENILNKINNIDNSIDNANNVPTIDAKLGNDIRITQSYLLNYTIGKSGIWYMSNGYIKEIKVKNNEALIQIYDDSSNEKYITATINSNKCNVKKGDLVNFVGSIDMKTWNINLTKISTSNINYSDITEIELNKLIENIELLKRNYFIISGYLVKEDNLYKLFDSKQDSNNKEKNNYFIVNWKNNTVPKDNQNIKIKCLIMDTYMLKDCEIEP